MHIKDFISKFENHPILFIGTGLSLRYLKNSYSWESLLKKISYDLTGNDECFYDLKSKNTVDDRTNYEELAQNLEKKFNENLEKNRYGKFADINDLFYENMKKNINISRFKLYISKLLKDIEYIETDEINELKKARKNIGSIITTNYDLMIEDIFNFNPLVGNDILLSNPYGSLYKIHGCVTQPDKIIITTNDYKKFREKYELIRAQLLSLFIHNPIIFLGYSISDNNIKEILKTIFTYINPDSKQAEKVRSNFLLVEYSKESEDSNVVEHDIDIQGLTTIKINKIKTNNFKIIYKNLSDLQLTVSAMDVRKVQNVVKDIYAGGKIKVSITEDLDKLDNSAKILAIGSMNTVKYYFQNSSEIIKNYFEIIEEENVQLLSIIDKITIQSQQYFPIFGFSKINKNILKINELKKQQIEKIKSNLRCAKINEKDFDSENINIEDILESEKISNSKKNIYLIFYTLHKKIDLDDIKKHLENKSVDKKTSTDYRRLLCAYDIIKYGDREVENKLFE